MKTILFFVLFTANNVFATEIIQLVSTNAKKPSSLNRYLVKNNTVYHFVVDEVDSSTKLRLNIPAEEFIWEYFVNNRLMESCQAFDQCEKLKFIKRSEFGITLSPTFSSQNSALRVVSSSSRESKLIVSIQRDP